MKIFQNYHFYDPRGNVMSVVRTPQTVFVASSVLYQIFSQFFHRHYHLKVQGQYEGQKSHLQVSDKIGTHF